MTLSRDNIANSNTICTNDIISNTISTNATKSKLLAPMLLSRRPSQANIRRLVCVDIAETSVTQCKERYDLNRRKRHGGPTFSAEFIVADCTKVRLAEAVPR